MSLRKEASGLRLFVRVSYTQEVRGSNPLLPTIMYDIKDRIPFLFQPRQRHRDRMVKLTPALWLLLPHFIPAKHLYLRDEKNKN
jgi:hypothetical protein